eukprot:CAMPEP_0172489056 /NCGR_PEP_ID=MMETSP1066-20121228/18815_1 /TAXON_ID=671091 /ORGANISM="Coscinodiscus wailesii, Strain CCMP2513" /LENGTH=483 /DNA_ID=CAMNT_0013256651 /DNA_START=119 /DNA_END=1567 /DNA_ORIENTATION=+
MTTAFSPPRHSRGLAPFAPPERYAPYYPRIARRQIIPDQSRRRTINAPTFQSDEGASGNSYESGNEKYVASLPHRRSDDDDNDDDTTNWENGKKGGGRSAAAGPCQNHPKRGQERLAPPSKRICTAPPKVVDESSSGSVTIKEARRRPNGSLTFHKYRRGTLLGKGSFATVYGCTSLDTQKSYAVKIVPKAKLMTTHGARRKLRSEIKIHRTLKHKNVCELKHFFEDLTNCYILLELCTERTLGELIKRRQRLSELEVIYFMNQIIEGLKYVHSNGVIHRDLKLGNLFLDKDLNVKIGDFGLATKLVHTGDRRNTICGTPNYIAPEVIGSKQNCDGYSFEVDVWAMGVIMYIALVGKPPYEAKGAKSTYRRILNNDYSFPPWPCISDRAKHLIHGMLQTNPSDRPKLSQMPIHPFFTHFRNKIPRCIPVQCTYVAPLWQEDEFGVFVAQVNSGKNDTSPHLLKSNRRLIGEKDRPRRSPQPLK